MAAVRHARRAGVRSWIVLFVRIFLVALFAAATGGYAANYVYDANGRLRAVTTTTGDSAEYVYDALGNLYAVNATPAAGLSIFTFTPNHGPVGSSVHISGQGFSPTPGNNTVKFNGTVVPLVAGATSSTLDVIVPPGATTGPVSVQVGSNTATSIDNFYVTTDSGGQSPTIDSFSPAVVTAGSTVTVSGNHFTAATGPTAAGVNQLLSTVTPVSDTQLAFVVPQQAGSGPVTVTTPYGAAESATPLIVIPSGVVLGSVIATGNMTVDGPSQAITIGTANKYGAITFDGVAGELVSLQFDQWSISPSTSTLYVTIYDSAGIVIVANKNVSAASLSVHLPVLKRTGTYLVLLSPSNATAQFSLRAESALVVGSTPSGANLQTSQTRRLQFTAQVAYEGISLSGFSTTPAGGSLTFSVYDPRGNQIGSLNAASDRLLNLPTLVPGNVYSAITQISSNNSATMQLALVPAPTSSIQANGQSLSAQTAYSGQNAYLNFTATAGENLGLGLTNLVITDNSTPKSTYANVTVYKPDGSYWAASCYPTNPGGGCELNLSNVPVTGAYSVVVSPNSGTGTLSFNAVLTDDLVVALPPNAATAMSLNFNGQNGRFTFSGTAGATVGLQIGGITTMPANQPLGLQVLKPDGTPLNGTSASASTGTTFNLANLPVTGTYTVFVSPSFAATAVLTATLVTNATVTTGAAASTITTSVNGVSAYFNFTATAGENLGLGLTGLAITDSSTPKSTYAIVSVYKPDGTYWIGGQCYPTYPGGGCEFNLTNAPVTGTYSVVMLLNSGTGTMSFNATVSDDVVVALPANTPTAMNLGLNGQNGRYTFSGTAGTTVALQVGGITTVPANLTLGLQVLKPDGTVLNGGVTSGATSATLNLTNLPTTGTYTVFVNPPYAATATFTATLVMNPTMSLAMGGNASAVNTTVGGQNAYLSFAATAGENLGLGLTNLVVTDSSTPKSSYASVAIYKPDGSYWVGGQCYPFNPGGGCKFNLSSIPVAGTYNVVVSPNFGTGTLSFNATVSDDLVVALPVNEATAMNLSLNGQNGRYTFSGAAGTTVALQIAGVATMPANQLVSLQVLKPDGTALSGGAGSAAVGTTLNLTNLPTTGTYTLFVNPPYAATAALTATLVVNTATSLTVGGNMSAVNTAVSGQSANLSFAATAGENLGLGLTSLVITDSSTTKSTYASVAIYKPDGSYWLGGQCYPTNPGSGCKFNLSNAPVTGTYSVVVSPNLGTGTLSFNATLSDDFVLALPANTATTMNLSLNGQNGRYTFSGTAGTTVGLQVGGIATAPTNQTVGLQVLKPDGTPLNGANASTATGATLNLTNLPTTGTYTLFVNPSYAATATLTTTLVTNATVTTGAAASTITTAVNGVSAYFSFTATAGENLGLGLTSVTITDNSTTKSTYANVSIYKPDGTYWAGGPCSPANPGGACEFNLSNAPAAGTYSVVVSPNNGTGTLSFNATLSDDLVVALPANTATAMNLNLNGQNGRYTFSGTAGATMGLQIGGIATMPANQTVVFQVLKPDGTAFSGMNASTSIGTTFNLVNLPTSGTYTVFVNPSFAATASLTATLVTNATLVTGAAASTIPTTANGAWAYFNFTATAGENLGLGLTNLTITDNSTAKSTYASVTIYKPDGNALQSAPCSPTTPGGGCDFNVSNAPTTGTYSVVVSPNNGTGTLSFNATVSDDVVVALPVNVATAMNLGLNGQNGRYTFSGTAGTTVALQFGGIATVPANLSVGMQVLKPDGTALSGGITSGTSSATLNLTNLPATGTYTVFVNPPYAATATLTATLVINATTSLTVGGNASAVSTAVSGQNAYLSFTATAGENLGLGLTSLAVTDSSTPKSTNASVAIYKPDSSYWIGGQCYPTNPGGGCKFNLPNVPIAGIYSVVVSPNFSSGTLTFNATVSDDLIVALPANTATTMNLNLNGQNGRYTFAGTAGKTVGLQISGITTVPVNQPLSIQVLKPDGTVLSGSTASPTTGTALNLTNLPTTGTYTLYVNPSYAATASLSTTLTVSQ